MHKIYESIPSNLLNNALCALSQANMHAAFFDPGNEHWGNMAVLNAAQAGELVMKAIIAKAHPLLIFKNIYDFDDNAGEDIPIERLLQKARTHDFQHLPKILWAVNKQKLPCIESFTEIQIMRNAIQHFYHPAGLEGIGENARIASLKFIYKNIDPLLRENFGVYAIELHEDHSVGYDHLVGLLLASGLKFSIPEDFNLSEISLRDYITDSTEEYQHWLKAALNRIGKGALLN